MTIQTVLANIIYDAYYQDPANSSKKLQIEGALGVLYSESATARAMLDQISSSQKLTINYGLGDFKGGGFTLRLDLNFLNDFFYITPNGKAVTYELVPALGP
jgi:hypothetical protein